MADNPTCATCRHVIYAAGNGYHCRLTRFDKPMGGSPSSLASWYGWVSADAWCGEHAPRVEAPKGGKPIVAVEVRIRSRETFEALALECGAAITGEIKPGDGFVHFNKSYIYVGPNDYQDKYRRDPDGAVESPDASV